MKKLFLVLLLIAMQATAKDVSSDSTIYGAKFIFKGGMTEALRTWKNVKNQPSKTRTFLLNLESHIKYGGDARGLDKVVTSIITDCATPSKDVLEGVLSVIYWAEEKHHPLPTARSLVQKIEASIDPISDSTLHIMILKTCRSFPRLCSELKTQNLAPGVVKTGSSYQDESNPGAPILQVGTGSIFSWRERNFLLTAAHVVAGNQPWVELRGRKIPVNIEKRLLDADHDVAIIELEPIRSAPSFILNETNFELEPSLQYKTEVLAGRTAIHTVYEWYTHRFERNTPRIHSSPDVDFEMGKSYVAYWLPKTPWALAADQKVAARTSEDVFTKDPPQTVSAGDQLLTHFTASPGLSGGALISVQAQGAPRFAGILTQYNRFFRDSYFATPKVVHSLLRYWQMGMRGETTSTRWALQNGLMFRKYSPDSEEVLFTELPSGNGVYADPGHGVYADPSASSKSNAHLASNEVMKKFGLQPGMKWQGKTVIGFRATPKNDPRRAFALYANSQAVNFMRTRQSDYTFTPIEVGEDLNSLLLERLRAASKQKFDSKLPLKVEGWEFMNDRQHVVHGGDIEIEDAVINVRVTSSKLINFKDGDWNLYLGGVAVTLDNTGRVLGQKHFLPVVDVLEPTTKKIYHMDLRALFFTDLSKLPDTSDPGRDLVRVPVKSTTSGLELAPIFIP